MLGINWSDVISMLNLLKPYLIAFAVVVAVAVIVAIAVMKFSKPKKKLIRAQAGIAVILALGITANLICTGPLSTILTLASGSGTITEDTQAAAWSRNCR